MLLENFKLERYFARYEFKTKYLFSSSDCDGYPLKYILNHASLEELKLWESLTLGYTESEGNTRLRKSISRLYQTITPNNIVVSSPGEANYVSKLSISIPGFKIYWMRAIFLGTK